MTEKENCSDSQRVWCRRLTKHLPIAEHAECPYCFGKPTVIEQGTHDEFCDFKEGQDPINFGFPTDTSRNLSE